MPRGEFELIDWIRQRVPAHPRVPLGIGDDAALVTFPAPGEALVTTDMLMDGVDFLLDQVDPRRIGWKALAVNLSDIAAMGGRAVAVVVSLALPRNRATDISQPLYEGIETLAARFNVAIAGGDTNTWKGPLVISITVLGEPLSPGPVRRSGAKPGDWIFVTGELGGSIAGHHLDFLPRLDEAALLQQANLPLHAMIDISDGFAADLHHILEESRCGAVIDAESLPISAAASSSTDGHTPLEHALSDGEDFELLFTVSPEAGVRLLQQAPFATRLTKVGEIITERECWLVTGQGHREPLGPEGWRHPFC